MLNILSFVWFLIIAIGLLIYAMQIIGCVIGENYEYVPTKFDNFMKRNYLKIGVGAYVSVMAVVAMVNQ